MFAKILIGVAVVVAVLAVFIQVQPDTFHYERSTSINAAPDAVFAQVNNFHNMQNWSPWAKLDPNAKVTFSGPDMGRDASFTWSGDRDVGEGSMTILDSQPYEKVVMRLDFVKPFKGTNTVTYTLKSEENGETTLTWAMDGKKNFITKAMSLVMNCDKMMGAQFDQGLASIKAIAEKAPE